MSTATDGAAGGSARRERLLLGLFVMLVAVATRAPSFGDVVAHVDEQYYLLMGDQLLRHHAMPYVDIWDRKPVGLMLLFAAIRLLGGQGIVQYQVVATLFAGATAAIIALWVRRYNGWLAGGLAALLYLAFLQRNLGFGGQAEVFLNLFIVGAGALVHRLLTASPQAAAPESPALTVAVGMAAMLIIGLAVEVKPSALFPGAWLGVSLLFVAYRSKFGLGAMALAGALWAATAALPTLVAAAWFAHQGHFGDFFFANVTSIGLKGPDYAENVARRLMSMAINFGAPAGLALAALAVARRKGKGPPADTLAFTLGWLGASLVGVLYLKNAYPHYALLMAPMVSLLVGYAVGPGGLGLALVAAVAVLVGQTEYREHKRVVANQGVGRQLEALAATIRPQIGQGCLFVFHGPVILYTLTESCVPTRFAFPNHLSAQPEAPALGVDASVEVGRILANRPPVIVTGPNDFRPPNLATTRLVDAELKRNYRLLAEVRTADHQLITAAFVRAPGH